MERHDSRRRLSRRVLAASLWIIAACDPSGVDAPRAEGRISLEEVAVLMARLPLDSRHFDEVHDAVSASSEYGYDEEYTMAKLFSEPGSGVAGAGTKAPGKTYDNPVCDLIREYLESRPETKSAEWMTPDEYIGCLTASGMQIYWPYSERWDGKTAPVITYDPGIETGVNVGYQLGEDGPEEIMVDEQMARDRPVWVINNNDDACYESIELRRRQDPLWATGGEVLVKSSETRTLILKDFTMHRHYDSWFAGASEFFVKCGTVENFTASTEAELRLYTPQITDFMIVVKREQLGQKLPFNAVLISDWTDQLDSFAFMIIEDDGGTMTSWKCSATVKIQSKSYGLDLELPFRKYDDVVWRGQLSSRYFQKNDDVQGRFGDVSMTFAFR